MKKTIYSFLAMVFLASVLATVVGAHEQKGKSTCHMKKFAIHIDYYYELLTEKHAPDLVNEWKTMSKQQQEMMSKLREDKDKKAEFKQKLKDSAWYKRHKELQKEFTEAVKERNENKLREVMPKMIEMKKELTTVLKETLE